LCAGENGNETAELIQDVFLWPGDDYKLCENDCATLKCFAFMFQKTKKPKFKVVIVKVKDAMNMTQTAKFRKALDLVMTAKQEELTSNE
jgi:hypothetical protein